MRLEPHLNLTLSSGPRATAELREAIEVFSRRYGLTSEDRFDLKLAATEALTNALKRTPEPHAVDVTLTGQDGAVDVEILDRGVFAPLRAAGNRDLEAESGRGIALMFPLVDDVSFERMPMGTRVRLRKRGSVASAGLRLAG
jgi:serine/threonine-protein kinase RsbW